MVCSLCLCVWCSSSHMSSVRSIARLPGCMTHHSLVSWPPVTQTICKHSSVPTSKYQESCVSVTHTSMCIRASQHTNTYFQESAEKAHVCTHMYAEEPTSKWQHIHMYTQTQGSQLLTQRHTLSRVHGGRQTDRQGAAVTGAALLLIPIRIHSCCVLSSIL